MVRLLPSVELNVRRGFGNRFDRPAAVLRMPHALADVQGFDFHGGNLTTVEHENAETDFLQSGKVEGPAGFFSLAFRTCSGSGSRQQL